MAAWAALAALATVVFAAEVRQRYISSGVVAEEARRAIIGQLKRSLGREVQLDGLRGDLIHGLSFLGFRVAEQGGFGRGEAFSAARIDLSFSWRSLLSLRPDFVNLVSRAVLVRPRLVITRRADGGWNIDDLLSNKGAPTTSRFRGRIGVDNGTLVFSDAYKIPSPFVATFERLSGEVGFPRNDEITLSFRGGSTDAEEVAVTGRFRTGSGASEFDITAANGSVARWGTYFVRLPGLDWERGRFGGQVRLTLTRSQGGLAIDFLATLRLHDADADYRPAQLSLRHGSGPITVDNLHAETTGVSMRANGSPVVLDGAIVFAGGPWIQIGLKSPDMDLGSVQALLFPRAPITLTGKAAGDVEINGPVEALDIDGEIADARGRVNGQPFEGLRTRLQYGSGTLTLAHLASTIGGGRLSGDIVLDISGPTPSYLFSGTTSGVDVAALVSAGLTGLDKVSGRVSGHVVGAGTGTRVQVMGDVTMAKGAIQGIAFDAAHAIFWHDADGSMDLNYVSGRVAGATVYSSGQIGADGGMNLDVFAHDLSLADLGARAGLGAGAKVPLEGQADLAGRATGTTAAPVFSGKVTATHGRVGPLAFAGAQGPVTVSPGGLSTPGLRLRNGTAQYRVSGGLTFHPPVATALRLEADDVDAQLLTAALASAPEVTGTMAGAVTVTGALDRPSISGHVALDRGSVHGQRIDHAEVQLAPEAGKVRIADARVNVGASRLAAAGTIDPAGALQLRFSAENVRLPDINALLGIQLPVEGIFAFTGEVRGTIQSPIVAGEVNAPALVVGSERFAATGAMDYESGVLRLSGVQLAQGASRYRLSGEIRPGPPASAGLALEVEQGRVGTVLSAVGIRLPAPLDGTVDGRIELSGPLVDPSAHLSLRLHDATFGAYSIGDGVADLTLTHLTIDIDRFEIHPAQGQVAAKGHVDLRGDSSVEISAEDLNPDFLRPFVQMDRPLEGRLNFTLQFSGPTQNPKAGLSLQAVNAGVSGVSADRITALAFYSEGTLTIEQGAISKGPHTVVALGTVPIDRTSLAPDPRGPLHLQLRLQDADLSFLSLLTPHITDAAGTVAGEVQVGGSLEAPQMSGFIKSTGGRLHYDALRTPIENLNTDLSFSQRQIEVHDLSGTLGQGRVAVAGVVDIANLRPANVRLDLKADHATIDAPDFYTGQVEATLTLNGPASRPTLAGGVTLSNGVISPGVQAAAAVGAIGGGAGGGPALGLDVNVTAGEHVAFTMGPVRADVSGAVHAGGTLAHPLLAGLVTSPGGEVVFLGTAFRLNGGEAVFSESLGVEPQISARAQQVYGDTIVFLDVSGPATHPELILTSNPPLPQDELVTLVARGAGISDPESVIGQGIGQVLFGPVREALHLNEFTIRYSRESPVTLRIGKFLVQNIYLTLSEVISQGASPVVSSTVPPLGVFPRQLAAGQTYTVAGLEYIVSPNVALSLNVDTLGGAGLFVLSRFPF